MILLALPVEYYNRMLKCFEEKDFRGALDNLSYGSSALEAVADISPLMKDRKLETFVDLRKAFEDAESEIAEMMKTNEKAS